MNKYKVSVRSSVPQNENVFKEKCFVGISMFNPIFRKEVMFDFSNWIDMNFSECEMVVADYLYRYNYMMFYNLQEDEAVKLCLRDGQYLAQKFDAIVPHKSVRIKTWKSYFDKDSFKEHHKVLNDLYSTNSEFRNSVIQCAKNYVERLKFKIEVEDNYAHELSIKYLIEEFAFICCMIDRGFFVSVYPGEQMKLLKEIVEKKKYLEFTNLAKGAYIDLKIKKK